MRPEERTQPAVWRQRHQPAARRPPQGPARSAGPPPWLRPPRLRSPPQPSRGASRRKHPPQEVSRLGLGLPPPRPLLQVLALSLLPPGLRLLRLLRRLTRALVLLVALRQRSQPWPALTLLRQLPPRLPPPALAPVGAPPRRSRPWLKRLALAPAARGSPGPHAPRRTPAHPAPPRTAHQLRRSRDLLPRRQGRREPCRRLQRRHCQRLHRLRR